MDSTDDFIHEASRLPKAYTCFNQLNLCINYDLKTESKQFVLDLHNAFSQCFIGFNENALHDDYAKNFDKPKDLELTENELPNQESCMYSNFNYIVGFFFFCYFPILCFIFTIDNE